MRPIDTLDVADALLLAMAVDSPQPPKFMAAMLTIIADEHAPTSREYVALSRAGYHAWTGDVPLAHACLVDVLPDIAQATRKHYVASLRQRAMDAIALRQRFGLTRTRRGWRVRDATYASLWAACMAAMERL